jgi:peptidoglycan biosynthesis protein MviN/MurJ (putative lipid II flippase)
MLSPAKIFVNGFYAIGDLKTPIKVGRIILIKKKVFRYYINYLLTTPMVLIKKIV